MDSHTMLPSIKIEGLFNCANGLEPLSCLQCINFKTYKLSELKRHSKAGHALSKSGERLRVCDRCSFQTHSNFLYLTHKLRNMCRKWPRSDLNDHLKRRRDKSEEPRKYCVHCPYVATRTNDLKRHILLKHTSPDRIKWFECEHCAFKTKLKSTLKGHVDSVHGNKAKFKCDHCEFESKSNQRLQGHVSAKHTEPDRVQWFNCEHCSYKSVSKPNLKHHVHYKHRERPKFRCHQCQFETKLKQSLENHISAKHTDPDDIEWFPCERCPYRAKARGTLKWHVDHKHDEKANLKCERCPYETKFKRSLNNHILMKQGASGNVQWFQCAHCPYKSGTKSSLKCHMERRHVEGKRFKCAQCPFATKTKAGLNNHILLRHNSRCVPNGQRQSEAS